MSITYPCHSGECRSPLVSTACWTPEQARYGDEELTGQQLDTVMEIGETAFKGSAVIKQTVHEMDAIIVNIDVPTYSGKIGEGLPPFQLKVLMAPCREVLFVCSP